MNMNKTNYSPITINEKYKLFPRVELVDDSFFALRFYLENALNTKQFPINTIFVFTKNLSENSRKDIQEEINYLIDIEKRDVDILCKYFEALEKVQ